SQNQADASYIEQLGLSFVALRLNVTPETVDAQHQQLLRYVLPASQNSLKVHLAEDAKRIKDNNVNSTFYMTSMRAWPAENRVDIRGELKTWIG
ncbi:TraE/TraK family type IV conjugative transfer system protein, partial [Klebsiella pneumoniae]